MARQVGVAPPVPFGQLIDCEALAMNLLANLSRPAELIGRRPLSVGAAGQSFAPSSLVGLRGLAIEWPIDVKSIEI